MFVWLTNRLSGDSRMYAIQTHRDSQSLAKRNHVSHSIGARKPINRGIIGQTQSLFSQRRSTHKPIGKVHNTVGCNHMSSMLNS